MLNHEQIEAYERDGFVKVEGWFAAREVDELATDMVAIIEQWGEETIGWKGPWRWERERLIWERPAPMVSRRQNWKPLGCRTPTLPMTQREWQLTRRPRSSAPRCD